jgi:hypothetical protein
MVDHEPGDRAARMSVEGAQVDRSELPARRAGEAKPREPCRDRSTNRRIEPQRPSASLPRVPNGDVRCVAESVCQIDLSLSIE